MTPWHTLIVLVVAVVLAAAIGLPIMFAMRRKRGRGE